MEIRKDFQPVETFLHRLNKIGEAFDENNMTNWPHLKNKEDFDEVYLLPYDKRELIERIYEDGRECAAFMSYKLFAFNYADEYPTLSSYIDSFEKCWVYQTDSLQTTLDSADRQIKVMGNSLWSAKQMLVLFKKQINLLNAVKQTLDILKQTHLYKIEKGEASVDKESQINIGTIYGKANINSIDNSINISATSNKVFTDLKNALHNSELSPQEKERLIIDIDHMQKEQGKDGFVKKYQSFMQNAANHMTVFAPFLPELTKLLG